MTGLTKDRYDGGAIALHWLVALLILAAWVVALIFEDMPRGPDKAQMESLHMSLGVTVFILVLVRLVWRALAPPPPPAAMPAWMRYASSLGHAALYLLMVAVPVVGIGITWLEGHALPFWGLFALDSPFVADRALADQLGELHEVLANLMLIVAALHAAAALFHQYVLKDGVLARMVPPLGHHAP